MKVIFVFYDFSPRFMAGRRRYLVNFSTMVQVRSSVMFLMLRYNLYINFFASFCRVFLVFIRYDFYMRE